MWVRGLKQESRVIHGSVPHVAPYVGAWIETCLSLQVDRGIPVAPYVGAWIETAELDVVSNVSKSHPMWVRGLKHSL